MQRMVQHYGLGLRIGLTSFNKTGFVENGFPQEKVVVCPDAVEPHFESVPIKGGWRHRVRLPFYHPTLSARESAIARESLLLEVAVGLSDRPASSVLAAFLLVE